MLTTQSRMIHSLLSQESQPSQEARVLSHTTSPSRRNLTTRVMFSTSTRPQESTMLSPSTPSRSRRRSRTTSTPERRPRRPMESMMKSSERRSRPPSSSSLASSHPAAVSSLLDSRPDVRNSLSLPPTPERDLLRLSSRSSPRLGPDSVHSRRSSPKPSLAETSLLSMPSTRLSMSSSVMSTTFANRSSTASRSSRANSTTPTTTPSTRSTS